MGFFGNNNCHGFDGGMDCNPCGHREEQCRPQCRPHGRPHCMSCFMMKKPCPPCNEHFCNSYPEPVFDECDDDFIMCCW